MTTQTDVVIIGSGPVGLFSIFECGMLQLSCHVFDTLDSVGGQCTALYPEKPIYDIPAHPCITGGDLANALAEQAKPFNPTYHLSEAVVKLEKQSNGWLVEGNKGTQVHAHAVLIAAGVGAFGPNRPPLQHIEAFEATGCIRYWVSAKEMFRDKRIVIAGGGDSAVDWAIELAPIAKHVDVVHRRAQFRCAPESQTRLEALHQSGNIELVTPYQLKALHGEGNQLTHVEVATLNGQERLLQADYLLPFFGLSMNLGPIVDWGLNMDHQRIVVDPSTMKTNQTGIYAIGDIVTYPRKLKLILTGFAEGAQAAHAIREYLYPDEVRHFTYSTTQGVPGSV